MSMTLLSRYFIKRKGPVLGIYGAFKNAGFVLALNAAAYLAVQPFAGKISFIPFLPNLFYVGGACLMAGSVRT